MNNLERLRSRLLPLEGEDSTYCDLGLIKREGFDAAIALDLPVKFLKWTREDMDSAEVLLYFGYHPDDKELYQYWVENIYKPE